MPELQPFNRRFNAAVVRIAGELFPTGYDVGANAPDSLESLTAHINAKKRMIVWNGASETSIFADSEINYAFRAWHDWCHWKGQFPFNEAGEREVFNMQSDHIRLFFGDTPESREFIKLLHIEVIAQGDHFRATGEFPHDQMAFTRNYLEKMES